MAKEPLPVQWNLRSEFVRELLEGGELVCISLPGIQWFQIMKSLVAVLALVGSVVAHADPVDVYLGTGGGEAKGIYRAKFDVEKGELSSVELAAEVRGPGFLAFHPDRTKLYAVASTPGGAGVVAYRVLKDGGLELLNSAVIGDGGGAHISVHPSGKFLLTAQYGGGSTALFPIRNDGSVGERAQLIKHAGGSRVVPGRQDKSHAHWTGYSADGRFAFVPDLGLDKALIYKVDADKPSIELHSFAESVPGGGPRHMKFSVDGRFIYLLNELSLSVTTFAYDSATGTTKRLTTMPALSEDVKAGETFNSASEILVHPSGKFVYSANRGNDSVTVYRANPATGELAVVEVESIRGSWPRNINMDSTGKWLLAAGARSNTISVFEIDQETGELTFPENRIINAPGVICILLND